MWGVLLLAGLSWAGDTPRPSPPGIPAPGECPRSFGIAAGDVLPFELAEGQCVAKCGGVLIPPADVAFLLTIQAERQLHLADIDLLKEQRRDLRAELDQAGHPWAHRLVGGAIGVTLGVGVGLTLAAYYTGPGGA